MKPPSYTMALLLCIISTGCNSEKLPATKAMTTESNPAPAVVPTTAQEVDRYEFVESELVKHPEDEKKLNHNYMGSLNGFDYISVRNRGYKIPSDQLNLKHSFALTKDTSKWIPLRIHFSHIKYELN
jgi:hypothetical protein